MSMNSKYDIFISYRRVDSEGRTSGRDIARTIKLELEKRGYKVFFDYSEIKDGDFEEIILPAVRNSKAFILVLSKDALIRCSNEGDWVRSEIATAIKSGCRIIPISPDYAFNGWPLTLPDELKIFTRIDVSDVAMGKLFEKSIDKLEEERIRPFIRPRNNSLLKHFKITPLLAWFKNMFCRLNSLSLSVKCMSFGILLALLVIGSLIISRIRITDVSSMGKMILVKNYEGKYGIKDGSGQIISQCQWDEIKPLSQCLYAVQDANGYWGIIDSIGTMKSQCQWKVILDFTDGMARVKNEQNYWGYIDSTCALAIPCRWKVAQRFKNGRALVSDGDGATWVIDKTGELATNND